MGMVHTFVMCTGRHVLRECSQAHRTALHRTTHAGPQAAYEYCQLLH